MDKKQLARIPNIRVFSNRLERQRKSPLTHVITKMTSDQNISARNDRLSPMGTRA